MAPAWRLALTFVANHVQERLRGLFSGVVPTLIRDAPYSGLYLLMFSNLRDVMDVNQDSPLGTFVAAMLAGGVATVVTHPPDVVRTRLQLRRNMMAAAGAVARTVRLSCLPACLLVRQHLTRWWLACRCRCPLCAWGTSFGRKVCWPYGRGLRPALCGARCSRPSHGRCLNTCSRSA